MDAMRRDSQFLKDREQTSTYGKLRAVRWQAVAIGGLADGCLQYIMNSA